MCSSEFNDGRAGVFFVLDTDQNGTACPERTQSWCFVPLLFSALGKVPGHLVTSTTSTETQIESAQDFWERLFSHWPQWRRELRSVIQRDEEKFIQEMLPKVMGARSWTTSLVYGEPKDFGRLPHPAGRNQDRILSMLPADVQNQIFASVATLTSD
ncbi:unnamed protein product [Durusdinium trenchii]|uniref:Uncharacterized protein n=1 Tax=Durusdinium trenchii TaxID=1381693 RepID=A0ABP0JIE2_9DINO